jgi:hypothetical protein
VHRLPPVGDLALNQTNRDRPARAVDPEPLRPAWLAGILAACFALYWMSSFSLEARGATTYFGADSFHYTLLAKGEYLDRIVLLHPVTVVLALGWMKLFAPLAAWLAPLAILKAMFALIGAVGTIAAIAAFARFMPARHAVLWAAVYAASTTAWYFSSIEESKIVSAALATVYIALYLRFRDEVNFRRALVLGFVLLAASLNEVVAAFLVAIPAVDIFFKKYFDWRAYRWLALHSLIPVAALLVLELVIRRYFGSAVAMQEGNSFVEMFLRYFSQNPFGFATVADFLKRWIFFNIAAPEPEINFSIPRYRYGGDFEPLLLHYVTSPLQAALTAAFGVLLFATFRFRNQAGHLAGERGLLLALAAYALARMAFFFFFLPGECLLYSPSVTLAHLLFLAIPFAASQFRYKAFALAAFAVLLFANNAVFIFTAQTIPLAGQ